MRPRRNSPAIDELGPLAGPFARALMPKPPKQAEMGGMETDAASVLLTSMQRSREGKRAKSNSKEDEFDFQLRSMMLPKFERQVMFAKSIGRRWMFDFACSAYMLAVEVEGLDVRVVQNDQRRSGREFIVGGRHATVDGIQEDMSKYNTAILLGWSVLRFSQKMVKAGDAVAMTQRVLCARGWQP